jgi:hypothetical protein
MNRDRSPEGPVRRAAARAAGGIIDWPLVDVVGAAAFVAAYWFLGPLAENRDAVAQLQPDGYRSVVILLASIGAALLGLTLTAMAILLAITPGDRLRVLLQNHRPTIVHSFVAAARALIVVTFLSVYLLIFRYGGEPNRLVRAALYGSLLLSALAFVRLVYVLNYLLRIGTVDKNEGTEGNKGIRRGRQHRSVSS